MLILLKQLPTLQWKLKNEKQYLKNVPFRAQRKFLKFVFKN